MLFSNEVLKSTSKRDRKLLVRVGELLNTLAEYCVRERDNIPDIKYECHSICRGLALSLPELTLVDGLYFGVDITVVNGEHTFDPKLCDHSWLTTPSGSIIDPYPVSIIACGPLLVVTKGNHCRWGGQLYIPSSEVTRRIATADMAKRSEIIAETIKKALEAPPALSIT